MKRNITINVNKPDDFEFFDGLSFKIRYNDQIKHPFTASIK